jgi:DNA mismatch repair protein MutS2
LKPREAEERAERHALAVLEFPRVLEEIAGYASSVPGRGHVLSLSPWREPRAVAEALSITDEMVSLLLRLERWSPPPIPDAAGVIRRAGVEGSVLDPDQLGEVLSLLRASRLARADLRRFPEELDRLAALGDRMVRLPEVEGRIDRSLDPNGGLSDQASPELARLRKSLRGSRSALVRRLERFVRQLPDRLQVPDASVTLRAGRYCVPVRREGMSQVGGIVHDESATHRTVFVEPPEAIEAMNRIAELEREESREVQRVLRELTDLLRPEVDELESSLTALAETDSLCARARYALSHGGHRPRIEDRDGMPAGEASYRAVDAVHPLLPATGEPAVPFNLQLHPDERVLLISGPNAGGKTVLLKAIGLLSVMAQSGIIPPTGEGTVFPFFRSFHAIIGDEQSIQASLSTFSAQVEGLRLILESADADSMVLVDELGGNTDPAEGGALAAALLLRLAGQGGLSVVTTHLGELKDLAAQESSIVNASLQFDTDAMQPTFRLVRDRPGRSYALEIAARLGLPEDVLSAARSRLSGGERRMEALLRELEEREAEVDRLVVEARSGAQRTRDTRAKLEEEAEKLDRRKRELEREGRKRAERYLLEARHAVEEEIGRLREAVAEARRASGGTAPTDIDEAVRAARAAVESRLAASRENPTPLDAPNPRPAADLVVGEGARSRSLEVEGEVLEIREGEAVLDSGGMRFTLALSDLDPTGRLPSSAARMPDRDLPEIAPATEIDLRGLRVGEVAAAVAQGLDAAIVNDLPSLRIIHGKGTGALRLEVVRLLDADRRVQAHRPGGFQEGGSGVTVVEFGNPVD